MADAITPIFPADWKIAKKHKAEVQKILGQVPRRGTQTCATPWNNPNACMCTDSGDPTGTWDQKLCGCDPGYLKHYDDGTWVTMSDVPGLKCGDKKADGGGVKPVADVGVTPDYTKSNKDNKKKATAAATSDDDSNTGLIVVGVILAVIGVSMFRGVAFAALDFMGGLGGAGASGGEPSTMAAKAGGGAGVATNTTLQEPQQPSGEAERATE